MIRSPLPTSLRGGPRLEGRAPIAWLPAAAALVVMTTGAAYSAATRLFYEDAFITLRYARNLAEGQGLVFNAGERVLGTTTPLFALLLAPVGLVDDAWLRPAAVAVGIASAGATILLLFRVCRRLGLSEAVPLAATILFVVSHELVVAGIAGMEMMLVVALMFAALALVVEEKPAAAGVVLGLLVICRVDGVAWVALVLAYAGWSGRRMPWRVLAGFAAALAPWLVFATGYFGSPLPHTLAAKRTAYVPEPLVTRLAGLWAMIHPFERGGFLFARVLDGFFVAGTVEAARRQRALLVPSAACLLHLLGLAAFAPHTATWHVVPAAACFAIVGAVGAVAVFGWALRPAPSPAMRALRLSLPAGLTLLTVWVAGARTVGAVGLLRAHMENERAIPQAAGEWLRAHSDPAATVFAEPIGFLGYHSRRYLWDTVGLVSPRLSDYWRRFPADNRWFFESLRDLAPDFVVLRAFERPQNRMFAHGGPLLPPEGVAWFDARYRFERAFTPARPGPHSLWIYRRFVAR